MQVNKGQEALEKKLGMLETHQKEIHDSLVSIEGEASRLYQVRIHPALDCSPEVTACSAGPPLPASFVHPSPLKARASDAVKSKLRTSSGY